jgi:hypothetical protein
MVSKSPWEVLPSVWKTESSFWVWVRGILRKGWSRHPVKIEYIRLNRKRIINPKEKSRRAHPTVWGMTCEICQKDHAQGDIEIDHKGDSATFTGLSDTESYVKHLYMVDFESLRALCKPCHKIVNHSQRMGVSFKEAAVLKKVVASMKLSVSVQQALLSGYGCNDCSNATKRKAAWTEIHNKEKLI